MISRSIFWGGIACLLAQYHQILQHRFLSCDPVNFKTFLDPLLIHCHNWITHWWHTLILSNSIIKWYSSVWWLEVQYHFYPLTICNHLLHYFHFLFSRFTRWTSCFFSCRKYDIAYESLVIEISPIKIYHLRLLPNLISQKISLGNIYI